MFLTFDIIAGHKMAKEVKCSMEEDQQNKASLG